MARNHENREKDNNETAKVPGHRQVILGGLSRIMATSTLVPLDVVQMRFRYPDTWCVSMLRRMVTCKGCPGPYEILSAGLLQRRIYSSLRWGIYYCRYNSHIKNCKIKGLSPLSQSTFLLKSRPVVTNVIGIGTFAAAHDYLQEKKKAKEHKVLLNLAQGFRSRFYSFVRSGIDVSVQNWPLDSLQTSIIATTLLHPLDVMKVRLQLYPEAWGASLFRNMLRCEGIRAPYTGLTASILRQTTYTTSRLGTYYCLYEHHKSKYNKTPSFSEKVVIGVYAGLVGAFVGCPSEIILVRMMADGPVDPYRRYRGLFDAFTKIWRTEGFCTLWRGAMLTMSRSVVISVAQIGTYAQARNYLMEKKRTKGFLLHLYTSMASSLVTALATLPLDTFKTRYQVTSNGSHKDVYHKFRQETGVLGFWRGFTPYYVRLTVHTIITFYLLELLYVAHRNQKKTAVKESTGSK